MKKITALLLCLCLLLAMVFTGCGSKTTEGTDTSAATSVKADTSTAAVDKPAEKVNLKISCWGIETDPNSKIIKEAVDLFNQKNASNATATVEFTEQEQYKTKIAAQMAGNEAPDLFNTWAAGFLKPFVKAGKVFSISEALDKDSEWKNRYVGGIFAPLTFDGKIYGAPSTQTVVCLFYNKEIFAKYNLTAPNTYGDLKKIIKTLNDNRITPFALGNKAPWVGAMMSELLVNRIGGSEPYNKVYDGTGKWEDPAFVQAGKTMKELVDMNAFPKGFNALDNDPAQALFKTGKAAMLVMGSWAIQQMNTDDSLVKGKIDVCKFPTVEGGKGNADSWLGQPDQTFAISESCKSKDAGVEFLKMVSGPEIQTKLATEGNLIATNTQVDASKLNPVAIKVGELQKDMKELCIFYDVGLGATIGNEYNNQVQAITAGTAPEEAFKKLQQFTEQNKEN